MRLQETVRLQERVRLQEGVRSQERMRSHERVRLQEEEDHSQMPLHTGTLAGIHGALFQRKYDLDPI